jgi:hypothetical protein
MMSIEFEPFNPKIAATQASHLIELVKTEQEWLHQSFPDTLKRYNQGIDAAIDRLIDTASHQEEINAFILRQNKIAVGIGTVIFNQAIKHPDMKGSIHGSDIDYWLSTSLSSNPEAHLLVASELLTKGLRGCLAEEEIKRRRVFATVMPDAQNPSYGFDFVMEKYHEPAVLSTGSIRDAYKLTKDRVLLQLYIDKRSDK